MNYNWLLKDTIFTKDKGKVFTCFSGGGGSSLGYKLAGFDVIGCNEIDKRMMDVYIANHNPKYSFLESISTLKVRDDLPKELYDLDILEGSPPCFDGETLVMTNKGFKEIKNISPSDKVLTHTNSFQPVVRTMNKDVDEYFSLKLQGSIPLKVTREHPFYVKRMNRRNKSGKREFSKPFWKEVKDFDIERSPSNIIKEQDYIGIAINNKSIIPKYKSIKINKDFLYIVGRWFGDGWLRFYKNEQPKRFQAKYTREQNICKNCDRLSVPHKRYNGFFSAYCSEKCRKQFGRKKRKVNRNEVIICCGKHEIKYLKAKFDKLDYNYQINEQRTTFRFTITSKELCEYFSQFGKGAKNKELTQEILDLPVDLLKAFLDGYLDADGGCNKSNNKWVCCSISKKLIFGIQHCVHKVYKVPTTMTVKDNVKYHNTIEGRNVNTNLAYNLHFFTETRNQQHGFYEDGYLWIPFREKKLIKNYLKVYNLSVEEDESYTVNNFICHNCSAFSMAGQREESWGKEKKFREGQVSQVLDTLFFDFIDLAKKLQPKIVIAENVKGLLQGQAKEYVKKIYQEFNNAGYNCDHYLLNASNMGVPQKRERVFFIAYRKDLPFSHFHLNLDFNEKPITFGEFYQKGVNDRKVSTGKMFEYWQNRRNGDANFADTIMRVEGKHRCFNNYYLYQNKVCNTYTSNDDVLFLFDEYRKPNKSESCCIGSFPQDYNFVKEKYSYVIGMSVPPLMTAKISKEIYDKWLKI